MSLLVVSGEGAVVAVEAARFEPPADHWIRRAVRLRLDLHAFDDARFLPYLLRCRQSGIDFTTMAGLGDTAGCRRALYELDKTCSADIPDRGEFYTFAEYLQQRLIPPGYDPRGVILALDEGRWAGFTGCDPRTCGPP